MTTTSTSESGAKVDTLDSIADLLVGSIENDENVKDNKELEDHDEEEGSTQSDESSDEEEEESNEEEDESEEDSGESNEEVTWGKTLGIDDSKVVLDEEGNFSGFNVKIDGKIMTVPTAEVIAGYQTAKSNTNKSQTLSAEKKEFEQIRDVTIQEYTKKLDDVKKLSSVLENNLVKEFQNVNWEDLRATDPAEYAAMIQDFQIRQQEIQQIHEAIDLERNKANQEFQENNNKAKQEYLKAEVEKVIERNPTWAQPEVFKKVLTEFKSFIDESYGFTEAEFYNIQDARIFEVLKDAKAYREGKKVAEKKLSKPVPKFQKPGIAKKTKTVSKLEQLTKAAKTAPPGRRKKDLEESAIAELLLGGNK